MCQWVSLSPQSHRLGGIPYLGRMKGFLGSLLCPAPLGWLALECGQTGPWVPSLQGQQAGKGSLCFYLTLSGLQSQRLPIGPQDYALWLRGWC